MPLYIACDHAGLKLKKSLLETRYLAEYSDIQDLGTHSVDSVDYPDYADLLADSMQDRDGFGLLICGSGIGISIAANRYKHIRAALVHDVTSAKLCRQHNNANVLVLGGRLIGIETAIDCVKAFLTTEFDGGRHQRRIDKFS